MNRRTFNGLVAAAATLRPGFAAQINSVYGGVRIGIGSYTFRGTPLDEVIKQVASIPCGELELESYFVEPGIATAGRGGMNPEQREALRQWRLGPGLDQVRTIRRKCDDAGIHLYAYNIPVDSTFTDAEIDRVFLMAQAMGVSALNVVATLPTAPRLAAPAEKYKMRIGFHPTFGQAEGPVGTGDSWRAVIKLSPWFGANPDLGQCANWGPDPVGFLREIHDRVTTVHTHDRHTDPPPASSVPIGKGQMPVKEILLMLQKEKFTFVPMLERNFPVPEGSDNVQILRGGLDYCKQVLGA